MNDQNYSPRKVVALIASGMLAIGLIVLTASSATAFSTKSSKNVIPSVTKICSEVANQNKHSQDWSSSFNQCVETLGLGIAAN